MQPTPSYLVVALGSLGDLHPMLRIATTLQALGRTVTFLTHTHHVDRVQRAGLECVGLGTEDDYERVLRDPDVWRPAKGFAALFAHYGPILRQVLEAVEAHTPGVALAAIAHPLATPALAIARERGLVASVVATYPAPSNLRTVHDPLTLGPLRVPRWMPPGMRRACWHLVEKRWIDPVALRKVNALRAEHGLAPVASFLGHLGGAPDLSVTLFPPWFGTTQPDWPQPLVESDFQLFDARADESFPSQLDAFLAAGDKPLVFTPGSANVHAADFFACALAAVKHLGRRAIFLTGERAQVPDALPASVLWQPYVPLCKLLPHAAALIHHGGIGTTAEALRAGVPQLVTPFAWDQFDNAARVAALDAGMAFPARRLRPRKLARSLEALLASRSIVAGIARCATRCAHAGDSTALCRQIESHLRSQAAKP